MHKEISDWRDILNQLYSTLNLNILYNYNWM